MLLLKQILTNSNRRDILKKSGLFFLLTLTLLLFACSKSKKTIYFETNGGEVIESVNLIESEEFNFPVPIKKGFEFNGWFLDSELTVSVNEENIYNNNEINITLYARWIESQYKIKFDTNGGETIDDLYYSYNTKIETLITPNNKGNKFIR